jgi:hypothetical protein
MARRRSLAGALLGLTALLALLVFSASAQVSPARVGSAAALPADPWTGQWLNSIDGATITLAQSGSAITGTSPCPGTTMFPAGVTQTGTVSGDGTTASFTYSGAPSCPGAGGTYQATMQPDARVIDVRGTTQFGTPFSTTFTYQGGGTEPRETPAAARPQEPERTRVRIVFDNRRFEPAAATVASGTRIRVCNESRVFTKVFSYSPAARHTTLEPVRGERRRTEYRLPGVGRTNLRPGQCDQFTVRNPTGAPLRLALFDELHSSAKLVLTIQPAP